MLKGLPAAIAGDPGAEGLPSSAAAIFKKLRT
jgi:hypothetical protein